MARKIRIVFLSCVLMLALAVPVMANTYTEGYLLYDVSNGGVVITGYTGSETTVKIPSRIAGYPVSEIAAGSFTKAKSVKTIHLPETIMIIEDKAFADGQKVVAQDSGVGDVAGDSEPGKPGEDVGSDGSGGSSGDDGNVSGGSDVNGGVSDAVVNLDGSGATSKGVKTKNGKVYTVIDNQLVEVNNDGSYKVIDRGTEYSLKDNQDGTYSIISSKGENMDEDAIQQLIKHKRMVKLGGVAAGIIVIFAIVWGVYYFRRRNTKEKAK